MFGLAFPAPLLFLLDGSGGLICSPVCRFEEQCQDVAPIAPRPFCSCSLYFPKSNHNKCGFLGSSSTYPAVAKRVAKVCVKVELSVSRIPTSGGCLIVGLPCPNLAKLHV